MRQKSKDCDHAQSEHDPPGVSAEEFARRGPIVTSYTPSRRAHVTRGREWDRTYGGLTSDGIEPKLPDDPFERWLCEVEDACFQDGRTWERGYRIGRRPWWRIWDFAQRMAWRHAPYSRLRYLLEPEDEEEEIGYRKKWRNRCPDHPQWDFFLRFLWLFARDSRLRRIVAPDTK